MTTTPVEPDNEDTPEPVDDEPNVIQDTEVVEVDDETGEPVAEEVEASEGVEETPVEKPAVEEVAPVTPTKLTFKGEEWDEDRLAKVVTDYEQHQQFARNIDDMLRNDPALKKEYAKALKRKGVALDPEWEALTVEAPATPKYTMAQIKAGCAKAHAEGRPEEAQAIWDEYVVKPREEASRREIAEYKARQDREHNQRTQAQQQSALIAQHKGAWVQAAKDYPSVLVADPTLAMGYKIKDPVIAAKFAEVNKTLGGAATVRDVLDLTLARLGKLGKPSTKTAPVSQTRVIQRPSIPKVARPESRTKYTPEFTVAS